MKRSLTEVNATYRLPQPGELNERLHFRTRQDVPAPGGGTEPVYTKTFECWGRVRQVSDSAYLNSMQTDEKITHVIVIRRRTDITNSMEVVRDGSVYRVVRVGTLNNGKQFSRISVKELGSETPDNPPSGESTFYRGYGYGR
ncbi:phage head closure protein [Lelliottia wanjuensis]|uniref:phage head closure protein n=1 Tax=Lelliottia wanjuensis TaxID=3050585 RepID=UPI00254C3B42|nr:phage head closure protein [Lelliottia sp. V106_16]MDK9356711.1 phage head closure protein [Lelliottia sp. V106_16]